MTRTRGGARTRLVALVALLALTAGACGPERPFELGLKEVPSDLLLGRQTKPLQPLPTQLPPSVGFFTDVVAPTPGPPATLPSPLPDPPKPPPSCPPADPLAPARLPVTTEVAKPPAAPATYTYATDGFIVAARPRTVAPTAEHQVGNVVPLRPGEFEFDVVVRHDERTTVTTYHVVPRTSTSVPPGLYIKRIEQSDTDLPPFRPTPELLVLPFPAIPGTVFNGAGSDGATTINYEGAVQPTERLEVCGTVIDTIPVRLYNGRATTARADEGTFLAEEFTATYNFAPQYGGLIVKHELKASIPGDVDVAARELRGRITTEPKERTS